MTDRPIIFSGPMVRALLAGRKTQTRRVIKPRPWNSAGDTVDISKASAARYMQGADGRWYYSFDHPRGGPLTAYVSRQDVGDRLYVRENWNGAQYAVEDAGPNYTGTQPYAADFRGTPALKWKPSIHMPRTASRLTLSVSDVRVQRLQDISEADALAEGAAKLSWDGEGHWFEDEVRGTHRCGFAGIWQHLHGAESWDANPWVVALTFSVAHGNIDRIGAEA